MKRPVIWVIDDDAQIRKLLDEYLTHNGFEVKTFHSGRDILKWLSRHRPDVLVLDRMMPDINGLDLCRNIRGAKDDVPIIVLSALGSPEDRISGFEVGADDYVCKPFLPKELTMRINALLRRHLVKAPAASPQPEGGRVSFGECTLDLGNRTLLKNGVAAELTSAEFALLAVLVNHPHQPLSRERLKELTNRRESENDPRSIDVLISRLRKVVEVSSSRPQFIQTIWGYGYVFVPEIAQGVA